MKSSPPNNAPVAKSHDGYTLIEKIVIAFAIFISIMGVLITVCNLFVFNGSQSLFTWNNEASEKYGNIGDFLGGFIGAIWGFAGVLLFFIALQLQRRTLKSQLDEMESTRAVINEELHAHNLQQFENKFFQFLQLYHQILTGIKVTILNNNGEKEVIEGREFFSFMALKIYVAFKSAPRNGKDETTILENVYEEVYDEYKNTLGQYFRTINFIIRFIDHAPEVQTDEERNFYVQSLRAQLSNDEVMMIAYNGFSAEGRWFTGIIDKYKLLFYLDFELKPRPEGKNKMIGAELLIDRYEHLKKVYKEQKKRVEFQ